MIGASSNESTTATTDAATTATTDAENTETTATTDAATPSASEIRDKVKVKFYFLLIYSYIELESKIL